MIGVEPNRSGPTPSGRSRAGRWRRQGRRAAPGGGGPVPWSPGWSGSSARVAPTAFLGEPAPGWPARRLLGLVAVALVAPLLVTAAGGHRRLRRRPAPGVGRLAQHRRDPDPPDAGRTVAAARASLRLPGGRRRRRTGGRHRRGRGGTDPARLGLAGAPHPAPCCSAPRSSARVVAAGRPHRRVVDVGPAGARRPARQPPGHRRGGVPALLRPRPAGRCSGSRRGPRCGRSTRSRSTRPSSPPRCPRSSGSASGSAWLALLAAGAVRRRRRVPYPTPGESRARR